MDVLEVLECLYLLTQFLASIQNKKQFIFNEFFCDAWSGKDSHGERLQNGWVLEKPKAGRINVCKSVFPREWSKENSFKSSNTLPFLSLFEGAFFSLKDEYIASEFIFCEYVILANYSSVYLLIICECANFISLVWQRPPNSCKAELNCRIGVCKSKVKMSQKRNGKGLNGIKGLRASV